MGKTTLAFCAIVFLTLCIGIIPAQIIQIGEGTKQFTYLSIETAREEKVGIIPVTVTLFTSKTSREAGELISKAVEEGKVLPSNLQDVGTFIPVPSQKISISFITDQGAVLLQQECGTTDGNGKASCTINVGGASCGKIRATYAGSEQYLLASIETPHCIQQVPFGLMVEDKEFRDAMLILFIFFGLLAAGLYASGRDPLAAFDITTPKVKGTFTYPSYQYKKIKLSPAKKIISGIQMGAMIGNLKKLGIDEKEIRKTENEMLKLPLEKKYALAVGLVLRSYPTILKRVSSSTAPETEPARARGIGGYVKRKLAARKEKTIRDVDAYFSKLIGSLVGNLSPISLVENALNLKTIEMNSIRSRESWKEGAFDAELRRLAHATIAGNNLLVLPLNEARLTIESTRISAFEAAAGALMAKGGDAEQKAKAILEDKKLGEREAMEKLLGELGKYDEIRSRQLSSLVTKLEKDSEYFGAVDIIVTNSLLAKDMAENNLRGKTIDEKRYNEIAHASNNQIIDALTKGYGRSISAIATVEAAKLTGTIKDAVEFWKEEFPPPYSGIVTSNFDNLVQDRYAVYLNEQDLRKPDLKKWAEAWFGIATDAKEVEDAKRILE